MSKGNDTYVNEPRNFANGQDLQSALREIRSFILSPNNLIAYLCVSVICVLIGPFGTGERLSLVQLITYWFTSNALTMLAGEIVMLSTMWIAPRRQPMRLLTMLVGAMIAGIFVTLLVYAVNSLFEKSSLDIATTFKNAWPIGFLIAITVAIISERNHRSSESVAFEKPVVPFLKRLPVHLGKELISLEAQDHYIKVVTKRGSEMLLFRFGDALAELEQFPGIQIHRSYWVARDAVTNTERKQGRLHLILQDQQSLPVSRKFLRATKQYLGLT